jgi:hypothetical protein
MDQLDGVSPTKAAEETETDDDDDDDDDDDASVGSDDGSVDPDDPPRLWASTGEDAYPGCAFTRGIGYAIARDIGVVPEPETTVVEDVTTLFRRGRRGCVVVGTDGVFDALKNEDAMEAVFRATSDGGTPRTRRARWSRARCGRGATATSRAWTTSRASSSWWTTARRWTARNN